VLAKVHTPREYEASSVSADKGIRLLAVAVLVTACLFGSVNGTNVSSAALGYARVYTYRRPVSLLSPTVHVHSI